MPFSLHNAAVARRRRSATLSRAVSSGRRRARTYSHTPRLTANAVVSSAWPTTLPTASTWTGCTAKSAAAIQAPETGMNSRASPKITSVSAA